MAKQNFKIEPHKWGHRKGISWAVCDSCGLVKLRNKITEWCIRMGCNASEHPQFKSQLKIFCEEAQNAE